MDSSIDASEGNTLPHLLVALAKYWLLLVLIPAITGFLTYAYLASRPFQFRSDAILKLSKEEVVILKSAKVFGASLQKVRGSVAKGITGPASILVAPVDNPDTYDVAVIFGSGKGATAILNDVILTLTTKTGPTEYDRLKIEDFLKFLEETRNSLRASLRKINEEPAATPNSSAATNFEGFGESVTALITLLQKNYVDTDATKRALRPTFVLDDVLAPPSEVSSPLPRPLSPFVTLACVLSFGTLLVMVLLWESFSSKRGILKQLGPQIFRPRFTGKRLVS